MPHEFVIYEKEKPQHVHVIAPGMGGEFTACGLACDIDSEDSPDNDKNYGDCKTVKNKKLNCPECISVIKFYKSIRL